MMKKSNSAIEPMNTEIKEDEIQQEGSKQYEEWENAERWSKNAARTSVTADSIEKVIKRLKKSTGGGPQQITPWMIRQAVEGSTNGSCALVIANLSNRMANGDFNNVAGSAFSMMRSVALWKNKRKTAVRPIGMGDALKGVMTRAHCDQIRELVADYVERNQFGMMKGGYEVGVHTMRALANMCKEDGDVILIIDFTNAFNSCNRNLLIKLAATYIPELAHLIFWLYANETEVLVSNGEKIISSEGVHQGCGFSNILFVLLMRYIMRHIPREGVKAKGSYLDDAFTKSKPAAVVQILKTIKDLEVKTNLKIKISKCHVHAPNPRVADECRLLIASTEEISESTKKINIHSNMNLKFLNTPIGTDEFVAKELNKKLEGLKVKINAIAEMQFKMEAFTLLRTCWS